MTSLTKEEYMKIGIPNLINVIMETETSVVAQVFEDGMYKVKSFYKVRK